ncbi:terpene cyclase/mutase family protein [Streptomyces chumphonensis]|uniref:Terpene cyclase/mutase family protein n=1 Tax=Streptomyces chumphonensis TaxID=1214925 RepID=A0A927EVE6_9ACTN|nr:prenyltransferase/squalene oxidase repeat-containing protein [Streptomyces chumphonensis]MBD3930535.1 terpene cyclase/mutase family protein [Streptomyces chumphonensis]
MLLRRCATALAAATVLSASAAPAALADASPSPSPEVTLPAGLYGAGDPQYDAVWRQSTALLAQDALGVTPAESAVAWLADQQCDDGSFSSYRADPQAPCDAQTPRDTNATAMAVQALAALRGADADAVGDAVAWLESVRGEDGGWAYYAGDPASDANSTAVVAGALNAAGRDGSGADSPAAALSAFQLGCDAPDGQAGAFAHVPEENGDLKPNGLATASAALGAQGLGLAAEAAGEDAGRPTLPECDEDGRFPAERSAQAAAAYLSAELERNGGYLEFAMPGAEPQPDHSGTALAVIALAAGGYADAAQEPLNWLADHHDQWQGLNESPAGLGQLVLAVRAAGGDPRAFGGTDLLDRLSATGPEPQPSKEPKGVASDGREDADGEDGNGTAVWWVVGSIFVAGVGVGLLVSLRKRGTGPNGSADGSANGSGGSSGGSSGGDAR